MKRVVITGMGIYSCIGENLEEVKTSLYNGKSGIKVDKDRIPFGYRSPLTGMVEEPDLKKYLSRRQRLSLGEEGAYAYIATIEALENAKITQDFLDANEVGILYGNDSTAKAVINSVDKIREKKDTALVGSGAIFQAMNSTVTMNLSTIFKLRGVNFTISAACASGSHAIGMAYQLIKSGLQDCIICGGAQEINKFAMGSFDGLGVFSTVIDQPEKASRPFDKSRDGLVPSGGAATLVVESYESAVKRGAPILGEIIGYGFSSNGEHISTPNVDGPTNAMSKAIEQANIDSKAIDYVNAHATSTPVGDANEAKAIFKVFGENGPCVSSTKSMTGHECWMAGASEVIYSMLMMQHDFIAPNINLEQPDEDASKLNLVSKTLDKKIDVFLSNSFGFGGTNSALIIKKIKE
ncbi:beta-ketoacyl-[acyl-carrier-protein] synthase family protein [Flavivirga aquimarina]|uniref:3-oxoacyl-[acyl-carrier-protein] synthase 1 n=1 Tax=Flavivirga aquimarina TaxID=2027862 RepID=A0ABT8WEZ5_9FLAO|nr:beta-ketoacyl-[acyl-carrier-protein] synthase family protein [Flavivirga aquimarina]MDO5971728.1 beta-ketoacyl-[acyl-carrier-protein] synthase family protein [Flavivirga aquimarina]